MTDHKQQPQKPTESTDEDASPRESEDARGAAVTSSGNKVHGDKLEGMIPKGSEAERANGRPTRDDGDNDDKGALGEDDDDGYIGKRH